MSAGAKQLPDILMEGYLMKKDSVGFRGFRTWKKFYFVLTKTSFMAYKKKEEVDKVELDQKDVVALVDIISVVHLPEKRTGCRFDITVKLSYEMKKYLVSLDGESVKDTKRWVRRLGRFAAAAKDKQKKQGADLDVLPAAPVGVVPGALAKRKPSDPDMEEMDNEEEHEEAFPQQPLAFEGEEEEGKPNRNLHMGNGAPVWDEGPPGYQEEEGEPAQFPVPKQQQQQQQQPLNTNSAQPRQQSQSQSQSQAQYQQHLQTHPQVQPQSQPQPQPQPQPQAQPQHVKQQPSLPNMSSSLNASSDPKQRLNAMLHNLGLSEDEEEGLDTTGGTAGGGGGGGGEGKPGNASNDNNNHKRIDSAPDFKGLSPKHLGVGVHSHGENSRAIFQDSDAEHEDHQPRHLLSSPLSSPKAAASASGRMVSKLSPDDAGLKRLFYILDLTAYLPKFTKEEYKLGDLFHMDDDTLTHLIPPAGPRSRLRCYLDDHVWEP